MIKSLATQSALILIIAMSCVPVSTTNTTQSYNKTRKNLVFDNKSYEDNIKTAQLFNNANDRAQQTGFGDVTPLLDQYLVLEFDDIAEDPENYRAKIIHCNADWTKSLLNNLDFLSEYNEFNVDNYTFSFDTKTPYVHYVFPVPRVKLPGNYLIKIYREDNENDLILTRRFSVFDQRVVLQVMSEFNSAVSRKQQQVDFLVNYSKYELTNPMRNASATLRQNQRWDNAISSLKPAFVKESQKVLEYRFFNKENNFMAGNEFRFFDIRSLRFPGQNVLAVNTSTTPMHALVMKDKPRIFQPYSQYNDNNGEFIIMNKDTGNGSIESNYLDIQFTLESEPIGGDVYVFGALTDWQLKLDSKMQYDSMSETYKTKMLLKQGWYDYQYYVKGDTLKHNYLEGNHFETENEYEIFFYYHPITFRSDLLVGYANITKNIRN